MRNMSFALTTEQVRARTKTVTRRIGWRFLRVGDLVQPVVKCQGLKPGESIQKIGGPIRVKSVRREKLDTIVDRRDYIETALEGFPQMPPTEFVRMFCDHMRPCQPYWQVTRIEFEYADVERTQTV